MKLRATALAGTAFLSLLVLGCAHRIDGPRAGETPTEVAQRNPALLANQWLQTSAEYEALCLQIYNDASDTLRALTDGQPRDEQGRVRGPNGKPMAVVMDLDETVLDNAAYQSEMLVSGKVWDLESWVRHVNEEWIKVGIVPGAAEFIALAESLGVTPIYISNRSEAERPGTVKSLNHHGVNVEGLDAADSRRLLLRGASGSKDGRREMTASRYAIVMRMGDNLGDMSGEFDKKTGSMETIAQRKSAVHNAGERWGREWFVLPNPTYGEWEKFLNREDPLADLRR